MYPSLRLFATILAMALVLCGPGAVFVRTGDHLDLQLRAGVAEAEAKQQYTCSMHPFIIRDKPGDCPICGMPLTPVRDAATAAPAKKPADRKIKYWVAPMDPTYIRDKPGKSPMGMDLVPVYEDQAATGAITIDPVTIQDMGVRTAPVVRRDLHRAIRTVGLIGYEEPRQYSVNSRTDGWVEKLLVNQEGQAVRRGQPLLEIYSPELVSAQEEYLLALRNRQALAASSVPAIAAGAVDLLAASRQRLSNWNISAGQIDELEKTGKVRKTLTLSSPYDGVVTAKKVNEGMYVKAGMELLQISDISKVWVYADIYEYELPWVKVGQEASIELPYQHRTLQGRISMIYPYLENKTRTVKARIALANPGLELKPDMYVNVSLAARTVKNALVIPAEAVIDSGTRQTVFVALGKGRFEPRQVKLGLHGEHDLVQVKEGLLAGEKVVTSAQFMLDSESSLRAAIRNMTEPAKTAATQPAASAKSKMGKGAQPAGKGVEDNMEDLFK